MISLDKYNKERERERERESPRIDKKMKLELTVVMSDNHHHTSMYTLQGDQYRS